jgi:CheY-like chemotaxis protein
MILIVDDHQDNRNVLIRLLRMDGHEAIAVADGNEALQYLKTHVPRLVILDYGLPDMDGLEVFKQMRNDPRLSAVPVIMFSAYEGARKEKALEAGVNAYVVKATLDWAFLHKEIVRLAGPGTLPSENPPMPRNVKKNGA